MAEFDESTRGAARKAALRASAGAVKRAFEDMLLPDEERAARDLKRAAESNRGGPGY